MIFAPRRPSANAPAAVPPAARGAPCVLVRGWRAWLGLLLLLAVGSPASATEEALGRLFFTPERRQALDRQRALNQEDRAQANEDATLTINGVVTRSSGRRTTWINGVPQNESEVDSGIAVIPRAHDPASVIVRPGESPATRAKVGETINRNTGEARSLLDDGRIVVNPRGRDAQR